MRLLRLLPLGPALVMVLTSCTGGGYATPSPVEEEPAPAGEGVATLAVLEPTPEASLPEGDAAAGQALFISKACTGCHVVQWMPEARGAVGPDLTHAANAPLIAGVLPNTEENLKEWLRDPPLMKPGTLMPDQHLTDSEIDALVAFMQTLE